MQKTGRKETWAALYARLSTDDGNVGESMSIQSQKAILERKAKEMGIHSYQFYVDDGYSGTNFNRPSFRQMIADIEAGYVNCVITKDLSRLGRNYLESGAYIEVFFPQHHVRYVAVNDGVDSANSGEMDIAPFKNILNEFYSRDISKKVKSGRYVRASQGKFMGTYAPTVRYIFRLALQGMGNNKIGKILYDEKIPKPAYYKQEAFGKFLVAEDDMYNWKQETIIRILRNPLYKGYFWVQKCDKKHFKQQGRGYIPMKDRTIIPSSHEAIVDEHTWDTVQEILDRHTKVKPCTSGYDNKFRGILKCADCGSNLMIHTDGRNPDRPLLERTYYQCRIYRVRGTKFCSQHRISAGALEELVLSDIQYHAGKVIKNREKFMRKVLGQMDTATEYSQKNLHKKVGELEKKLRESDSKFIRLYEDLSKRLISEEQFRMLSAHFEQEKKEYTEEIEKLNTMADNLEDSACKAEQLANEMAECAEIKELTTAIVNRLIEKIEVSEPQTINGEKVQNIRIFYKFVGEIN
ncbi:MAG: recombinase family protein [Lachnospiraceae bacterium]|nr:recombinase family protein [Lachnospiraceae bacterium]